MCRTEYKSSIFIIHSLPFGKLNVRKHSFCFCFFYEIFLSLNIFASIEIHFATSMFFFTLCVTFSVIYYYDKQVNFVKILILISRKQSPHYCLSLLWLSSRSLSSQILRVPSFYLVSLSTIQRHPRILWC